MFGEDRCKECGADRVPEAALPDADSVRVLRVVLALEAIYAAMVDMEEFVNSTTTIHYKRRDQLSAKTAAVREAVQAVRQNAGRERARGTEDVR